MTTEEKFHAAVGVIKGLPKNGCFQPSQELMLKFYSFYKQATEGPCTHPKPAFWDLVKKTKWDAWRSLGSMTKEAAMQSYVDELKKIVETMSFSENVAEFMEVLGPFYELVPIKEKAGMNGDSHLDLQMEPLQLKDKSLGAILKQAQTPKIPGKNDGYPIQPPNGDLNRPHAINGHGQHLDVDSDGEQFSDTYDDMLEDMDEMMDAIPPSGFPADPSLCIKSNGGSDEFDANGGNHYEGALNSGINGHGAEPPCLATKGGDYATKVRGGGDQRPNRGGNQQNPVPSGNTSGYSSRSGGGGSDRPSLPPYNPRMYAGGAGGASGGGPPGYHLPATGTVNEQLALAVIRMQQNIEEITNRLERLESLLATRKNDASNKSQISKNSPWYSLGLPMKTVLLLIGWPVLLHWLIYLIRRRRRM